MTNTQEDEDLQDAKKALRLFLTTKSYENVADAIDALIDIKIAIMLEQMSDKLEGKTK
jgi:hypothetical protein